MATLAFDTLRYARTLEAAGIPASQAEVQAELMAEAFGFYAENLLTRDHFTEVLNARFSEFAALMDRRFAEQAATFEQRCLGIDERCSSIEACIDQRYSELESRFDKRCSAIETYIDQRYSDLEIRFDKRCSAIEIYIDQRCSDLESRFDKRCSSIEACIDQRYSDLESRFDKRCSTMEATFERRFAKVERSQYVHTWMLGVVMAVLVVPQLHTWLG